MNETTKKVHGVAVEVRGAGFSWRATVEHLGTGGTRYEKFNGRWVRTSYDYIPGPVYRQIRAKVREAVSTALGK